MTMFLVLFLSLSAFAQQFQYRLDGSFQTQATPTAGTSTTINYTLQWNETASEIQGIYQDNYFSGEQPRGITGTVSDQGRTFNLILPNPVYGANQILIQSTQPGIASGIQPVTIQTKTRTGALIDNNPGYARVSLLPGENGGGPTSKNDSCVVGFGSLTKLCGLYRGSFNEISDPQFQCDIASRNPRLELSPDTVFRVILDYAPGVQNLPTQVIGPFIPTPTGNTINIVRRDCGLVQGTSFPPGSCRTFSLSGAFRSFGNEVQFTGTYSISDDFNGEACSYTLLLRRDVIY